MIWRGRLGPVSTDVGPTSTKFGPELDKVGQLWPYLDHIWPGIGKLVGRTRTMLAQFGPVVFVVSHGTMMILGRS